MIGNGHAANGTLTQNLRRQHIANQIGITGVVQMSIPVGAGIGGGILPGGFKLGAPGDGQIQGAVYFL